MVKVRKYAPPSCNTKNPLLNRPPPSPKYSPRGDLYLEIALKYKIKHITDTLTHGSFFV